MRCHNHFKFANVFKKQCTASSKDAGWRFLENICFFVNLEEFIPPLEMTNAKKKEKWNVAVKAWWKWRPTRTGRGRAACCDNQQWREKHQSMAKIHRFQSCKYEKRALLELVILFFFWRITFINLLFFFTFLTMICPVQSKCVDCWEWMWWLGQWLLWS